MKSSMETASALMRLLSDESGSSNGVDFDPAWSAFMAETSAKMEIIKDIKWDPTNEVDKEIHDMQVRELFGSVQIMYEICMHEISEREGGEKHPACQK
jgi:hypothetical protein